MEAETQGEVQNEIGRISRFATNVTFAQDPLTCQSVISRCHPCSVE